MNAPPRMLSPSSIFPPPWCRQCLEQILTDHSLLVANICTRSKKNHEFPKRRPKMESGEVTYTQPQKAHDILEVNFGVVEYGSSVEQYLEMCVEYDE